MYVSSHLAGSANHAPISGASQPTTPATALNAIEAGTTGDTSTLASSETMETLPNTEAMIGRVIIPAAKLSTIRGTINDFSKRFGMSNGARTMTPKNAANDKYQPTLLHN